MRGSFSLKTHFLAALAASSLIILSGALLYLHCLLKEEALDNAQKLATLLIYQKLASRASLAAQAASASPPSGLEAVATRDPLPPPWVLSGETVRRLDDEFSKLDRDKTFHDHSFRECRQDACIPASGDDDLERNFLARLSEDPSLQEWHGVRSFDGKEFFVQMFRGETGGANPKPAACAQTDPASVAAGLTSADEAVSVISVRIPLSDSYALANQLTFEGALFIVSLLVIAATVHQLLVGHNILTPLEELHRLVTTVTDDRRHLGETISIRANRELDDLARAFNRLSITMGEHHRDLHAKIDERTRELRERKEKLRQSERQVRLLLDSAAEAIYGVDPDGNCTFCNPAALRILGRGSVDELLGRHTLDFLRPAELPVPAPDPTSAAYRGGRFVHLEKMPLTRPDGTSLMVELWAHPMLQDGVCHGAVVSFLDITERLNLQQQNLRAAQLASIGEIATGVAHEINNPISGVINYSQYLLSRTKTEETSRENLAEILQRIIREGNRVALIVKNLLFFSRDSGNLRSRTSMQSLFEDVFCLSGSQLDSSGITVLRTFPERPVMVLVNPQQLEQVLLNLINNARYALNEKFAAASGEKTLEITITATDSHCRVQLRDNGIGIPTAILARLGTPFVTTKPAGVGTGLGLSISQEIVRRHDGHLTIDSREHEYTLVTIELPLAFAETREAEEDT